MESSLSASDQAKSVISSAAPFDDNDNSGREQEDDTERDGSCNDIEDELDEEELDTSHNKINGWLYVLPFHLPFEAQRSQSQRNTEILPGLKLRRTMKSKTMINMKRQPRTPTSRIYWPSWRD